ncbi:M16 family metallopeptidase [Mucilaginibacter auburnensis]|uniref:Putative Zn-dependent peptidase n=1 Tax=Mucilaginibacter auburnensis TaxID=1457233 RepID=A0A2H9VUZ8_9SPHI|nr:pitrilysin family protein [Mucilaginibacter auburnensis]PJJ84631.1 putative Zn-dependent peptidase [Mucilaginibacter auburnensis]
MNNDILNRSVAPDFRAIENIHLIKPGHTVLPNGCNLFCFNSGDQELVRIEWIFGNLRFDAAKPLLNMAVNTMLTDGTSTLTAAEIADRVDFYGAFFSTEYGFDHSQVTLHSLNKHLNKVLPIVKEVLTDSIFPEKELDTYIRNQQQKLQVSLKKNDVVARRTFNKAVYGDTLYGVNAEPETYSELRRDDLLGHFRQMYQPTNCTLIVAGKIDEVTLAQLTSMFGSDWQGNAEAAVITQPAVSPSAEKFYFVEKPEALQSAIRIGLPFIQRDHPDFPYMQVLNTVLGGYFGSRLMANIREDKGYTYGIGSGISSLKHGAAFFIATEVGADVCRDAVKEIEKEINLLKTEPVPQEEISLVQNFMLGSLLGSLENVFSHSDKFKNIYFSGVGYEYYDRYAEAVKTVTAEQLQQLANQYWNFDEFYKVIVGKY